MKTYLHYVMDEFTANGLDKNSPILIKYGFSAEKDGLLTIFMTASEAFRHSDVVNTVVLNQKEHDTYKQKESEILASAHNKWRNDLIAYWENQGYHEEIIGCCCDFLVKMKKNIGLNTTFEANMDDIVGMMPNYLSFANDIVDAWRRT